MASPQLQRKAMARSTESYLISGDYILRTATEHSPPSDCYRLSKTECRDRSEGSSSNRIARTDRDRVATLRLLPSLESIGCAEARQRDRMISSRPASVKT